MLSGAEEHADLHEVVESAPCASGLIELVGDVMSLWTHPEKDLPMVTSLLVSLADFLENHEFLDIESYVPVEFVDIIDDIVVHGHDDVRLCEICLDLLVVMSSGDTKTRLVERILGCQFWMFAGALIASGLSDSVISLLCQVFEWFDDGHKEMLVNNTLPVCLEGLKCEGDSWMRLLYAFTYYYHGLRDEQVAVISDALFFLLLNDTDSSKLILALSTMFRITDKRNYKQFFFTNPILQVSARILSLDAPDVQSQLFALFARLCQLCESDEGTTLLQFDFAHAIHILASITDSHTDTRINGMNFLTNASTCTGIPALLVQVPELLTLLQHSFEHGSFDEVITACHLYTNLIDRQNISNRVAMSTNQCMSNVLTTISNCTAHKRLRRQVVHVLRNTLQMSESTPTAHQEMLGFLLSHTSDLEAISSSTTDPKTIADLDALFESLNV